MKRPALIVGLFSTVVLAACENDAPTAPELAPDPEFARTSSPTTIGINVLLDRALDDVVLTELGRHGRVAGRIDGIRAVFLVAPRSELATIRDLPFVAAANPDARREASPPLPPVEASDFADGLGTWDLDAVDVAQFGVGRTVAPDGTGVYVGILDSGLLDTWPFYLPDDRIAAEHARSFTGGGVLGFGNVATQPNKWERDTRSHGTHVTSTVLGYRVGTTEINGVAPRATVIPVKVLNNNGGGWSSTVAQGIVYLAELKASALGGAPLVLNMSLGGTALDAVEQAAIDYAISLGVIIVAAAGNFGDAGMGFPAAYAPVISVGASGWVGEWLSGGLWWLTGDVPDPTDPDDFYVTPFSSRAQAGQDLDVLAPGSWVLGPWQTNMGQPNFFFVGGTSQASPHVAGIVALMAQVEPTLSAADAEAILESTAVPLEPGVRSILTPFGPADVSWGADATGSGLVSAPAALAQLGG